MITLDILRHLMPHGNSGSDEVRGRGRSISPLGDDDEISLAYQSYYPLLSFLAAHRFRIPEDEVRPLIHEVFVALLRNRAKVEDVKAWLVGAMCNRCRFYWRSKGREDLAMQVIADQPSSFVDDLALRLDVVEALRRMAPRCREVLHLRFVEALSSAEIAAHFATTVDYARKLVYRCALSARSALRGLRRTH